MSGRCLGARDAPPGRRKATRERSGHFESTYEQCGKWRVLIWVEWHDASRSPRMTESKVQRVKSSADWTLSRVTPAADPYCPKSFILRTNRTIYGVLASSNDSEMSYIVLTYCAKQHINSRKHRIYSTQDPLSTPAVHRRRRTT